MVAGGRRRGRARDVQQAAGARAARRHRARAGAGRSAPPAALAVRLGRSAAHAPARPAERRLPADARPAPAADGPRAVGEQRRRRAGHHVGPAARAARATAGGDLGGRAAVAVAGPADAVLRRGVRGGRAVHVRLGCPAALPGLHPPLPFAAGIVAMERHLGRVWGALFALNGAVSLVLGLPLVPVGSVGATPMPDVNLLAQDSVGWPAYVRQVTDGVRRPAATARDAAVFTSNYGEAGAVHHYRPDVPVYSAQNALYDQARPPDVGHDHGGRRRAVRRGPRRCSTAARSAPGSTTASTSTTRSRACRSRSAPGRPPRGPSSGHGCTTSTEPTALSPGEAGAGSARR